MSNDTRPNILFILADDLGWGDVSYHGSAIRTPNIDRLVSYGVELDHHYVCPVCTPTRTSLMTGRYPGRFGRHATSPTNNPVLPDGYETIAAMLRRAGYDTGLFGKWHLGSDPAFCPNRYGFNASYGSLAGGVDPYSHRYKRGPYTYTWHRNGERVDEPGHATDLICREAAEWIAGRTSPWFCYVPFTAVHVPIDAPSAWLDAYAGQIYDSDPAKDASFKRYAAYTSHMDAAIGRLMDVLKEQGEFENTIVVFASDNGASGYPANDVNNYPGWHWGTERLGSNLPLRGRKGQLYEGGIRTPAVIAWPGVLPAGKCREPIGIVDWMPTFANLVGASPATDPQWDGQNVWPVISDGKGTERSFYWNLQHTRFARREGDWKVIQDTKAGTCELYNIAADPYEQRELSAAHPDIVQRLLAGIAAEHRLDDSAKRPDAP